MMIMMMMMMAIMIIMIPRRFTAVHLMITCYLDL